MCNGPSVDEVAAYMTWQVGAALEELVKNSSAKSWEETLTAIVVSQTQSL